MESNALVHRKCVRSALVVGISESVPYGSVCCESLSHFDETGPHVRGRHFFRNVFGVRPFGKQNRTYERSKLLPVARQQRMNPQFERVTYAFAGSGARVRVTSHGGEEGDINFCRNCSFLGVPFALRFDAAPLSFVH